MLQFLDAVQRAQKINGMKAIAARYHRHAPLHLATAKSMTMKTNKSQRNTQPRAF